MVTSLTKEKKLLLFVCRKSDEYKSVKLETNSAVLLLPLMVGERCLLPWTHTLKGSSHYAANLLQSATDHCIAA